MHLVTPAAMRPASTLQQCFYCQQAIGTPHKPDCVTIQKKVKVRMIAEYEIEVPHDWDKETIEFQRNEGSWCSDNAIDELTALNPDGCLCGIIRYEYLADTTPPFLREE